MLIAGATKTFAGNSINLALFASRKEWRWARWKRSRR
jgi:hypothetical protein